MGCSANGWRRVALKHYGVHVIEERFEIPFVAELALREKQIQQNYRPVIAVHKWFARRPGTLFRSLLLSEFCDDDLPQAFFTSQNLSNLRIADPFMGGGIPLLEANRVGSAVLGFDINPMAWWIVREEIETLDVAAYRKAADELRRSLDNAIGGFLPERPPSLIERSNAPSKVISGSKRKRATLAISNLTCFRDTGLRATCGTHSMSWFAPAAEN